ncbi:RHS repeat domain-containing protein [Actinokineospora inagensis]|uniref:RHS repeat domain-containing protein n=1 Tax=Actinokineospora inagensis TaxID=103730 RepID=UPI0004119B50|nr:RHS repeat domain-containing protein [Actinokineospora inagensis]
MAFAVCNGHIARPQPHPLTHSTRPARVDVDPPDGGTPTTTVTDARGKTTQTRHYLGTSPTGAYQSTDYTYTARGDLSTITDPTGSVNRFFYDLRGLKTRTEDPAKGVTTMTYDDAGRIATSTDARGVVLAYSYDQLSRRKEMRDVSATGTLRAKCMGSGHA